MVIMVIIVIMAWFLPIVVIGAPYDTPLELQQNQTFLDLAGSGNFRIQTQVGWGVDLSVSRLQPNREFLARTVISLYLAFLVLGGWMFYRLFQTYEHGNILTAESAQRLKHVGFWMMGMWVCSILFQLSKLWWELHPSYPLDLGAGLIPGLFICLIAWIMEEAHLIADEQALTV